MLQDFFMEPPKFLSGFLDMSCDFFVKRSITRYCTAQVFKIVNIFQPCAIDGDAWLLRDTVWRGTSIFLRMIVRPNTLDALVNLWMIVCRWFSWWAMRVQSSVNRTSVISLSSVFVFALSCWRSNSKPSRWYLMYTSRSRSLKANSNNWIKNRLNSPGAMTQPCFTPLEMLNF